MHLCIDVYLIFVIKKVSNGCDMKDKAFLTLSDESFEVAISWLLCTFVDLMTHLMWLIQMSSCTGRLMWPGFVASHTL